MHEGKAKSSQPGTGARFNRQIPFGVHLSLIHLVSFNLFWNNYFPNMIFLKLFLIQFFKMDKVEYREVKISRFEWIFPGGIHLELIKVYGELLHPCQLLGNELLNLNCLPPRR